MPNNKHKKKKSVVYDNADADRDAYQSNNIDYTYAPSEQTKRRADSDVVITTKRKSLGHRCAVDNCAVHGGETKTKIVNKKNKDYENIKEKHTSNRDFIKKRLHSDSKITDRKTGLIRKESHKNEFDSKRGKVTKNKEVNKTAQEVKNSKGESSYIKTKEKRVSKPQQKKTITVNATNEGGKKKYERVKLTTNKRVTIKRDGLKVSRRVIRLKKK